MFAGPQTYWEKAINLIINFSEETFSPWKCAGVGAGGAEGAHWCLSAQVISGQAEGTSEIQTPGGTAIDSSTNPENNIRNFLAAG